MSKFCLAAPVGHEGAFASSEAPPPPPNIGLKDLAETPLGKEAARRMEQDRRTWLISLLDWASIARPTKVSITAVVLLWVLLSALKCSDLCTDLTG